MTVKIFLAAVLFCPLASWAADDIKPFDAKPGLWETTVMTQIAGMPAMPAMPQIDPEMLKNMPPEQRARIEAMMKGGMTSAPRTVTNKVCVTKESLARGFNFQDQKDCTQKILSSTGTKMQIHMECAQGSQKSTGDVNVERMDADHVKGDATMKVFDTSQNTGRSIDMKMSFMTKFLKSDCGDVKPAGQK